MSYATVAALLERESAEDLAQAAAPEVALAGATLTQAVAAQVLPADEQEKADLALGRLEQALTGASATINGLLAGRYPALAQGPSPPDWLATACLDIALYGLLGGDEDSQRRQVYEQTMRTLRGIAMGNTDLYAASEPESGEGALVVEAEGPEVFSRRRLANYVDGYDAGGL